MWKCLTKPVTIDGQTVHVREMDGHTFGLFLNAAKNMGYEAALQLVLHTVCDETGKCLFSTLDDVGQLPRRVVDELSKAASEINKLGESSDDSKSPAPSGA